MPSFIVAFVWLSCLCLSSCDLVSNWLMVGDLAKDRTEIRIVILEGDSVLDRDAS